MYNVEKFEECAFFGCDNLTNFVIPVDVDDIPQDCFSQCLRLEQIAGMERIKAFGAHSFDGCHSLHNIPALTAACGICEYAFCRSGVECLDLRDSVCSFIDKFAFADSRLRYFKPGYFLRNIDPSAFENTAVLY